MITTPGNGGPRVVILAGGKGARLQPFTTILPKPLLRSAIERSSRS